MTDNRTELMWQKCSAGQNPLSCSGAATAYNWYQATGEVNALYNPADGTYKNICGQTRASYSDWRLPTVKELQSLADYSPYPGPAINAAFPDTQQDNNYWSSTANANDALLMWLVDFSEGYLVSADKSSAELYVRCVRGAAPWTSDNFTANPDDTVTDTTTGMIWQQDGSTTVANWGAALGYCRDSSLANQYDWRLPTLRELMSIVDYSIPVPDPSINPVFLNTAKSEYSSSTSYAADPTRILTIDFYGGSEHRFLKSSPVHVRCVRGGDSAIYSLVVQVLAANGATGTVTTSPSGIVCTTGQTCASLYSSAQAANPVTLLPAPAPFTYVFAGFGNDCAVNGQTTMDTDRFCSASFDTCSDPLARIGSFTYTALTGTSSAYSLAFSGSVIELIGYSRMFIDGIAFDLSKTVTLKGGLGCGYSEAIRSFTYMFGGAVTVANGTVIFDHIVIM